MSKTKEDTEVSTRTEPIGLIEAILRWVASWFLPTPCSPGQTAHVWTKWSDGRLVWTGVYEQFRACTTCGMKQRRTFS